MAFIRSRKWFHVGDHRRHDICGTVRHYERMTYVQPLISVDVVPLCLSQDDHCGVDVILGERLFEPFKGDLALPGVLLQHELVREAAARALDEKVGVSDKSVHIVDSGVFDNPDRDPRGPTLSISHLAAVRPHTKISEHSIRMPLENLPALPFDHSSIITAAAQTLLQGMWVDRDITRAFLGDTFSTRDAGRVQRSLLRFLNGTDEGFDAANLGRKIQGSAWVRRLPQVGTSSAGGGRPPALWTWS